MGEGERGASTLLCKLDIWISKNDVGDDLFVRKTGVLFWQGYETQSHNDIRLYWRLICLNMPSYRHLCFYATVRVCGGRWTDILHCQAYSGRSPRYSSVNVRTKTAIVTKKSPGPLIWMAWSSYQWRPTTHRALLSSEHSPRRVQIRSVNKLGLQLPVPLYRLGNL